MRTTASTPPFFSCAQHLLQPCLRPRLLQTWQQMSFSQSARPLIRTKNMIEDDFRDLVINRRRLMHQIHETCEWGKGERWGDRTTDVGMSRLSLSDADKKVRDWFQETTEKLGCKVTVDSMGNQFAVMNGAKSDKPATFAGSHLDTQPTGGRYDGILGVLAGVEMLKVMKERNVETEYGIGVVNWTNEEGARFPISMVSSAVWAGDISVERAHGLKEVGGGTASMKSELERTGYLGSVPCSYKSMPMAAHFELHIEQGPILERERRKIGIVKGVQAYRWFTIEIKGQDCHTGTTPFESRADAMLLASKFIVHSHRTATAHGALASTGILTLMPGSTNTVPGNVKFSLDIRAAATSTVDKVETQLREDFKAINEYASTHESGVNAGTTRGLPSSISWTLDSNSPATDFHETNISCVRAATQNIFSTEAETLTKELVSGAGHDSVPVSKRCPTSMIFVPCRDGVSHNPKEYCGEDDCELGARVLMQSVLRFDKMRSEGKA